MSFYFASILNFSSFKICKISAIIVLLMRCTNTVLMVTISCVFMSVLLACAVPLGCLLVQRSCGALVFLVPGDHYWWDFAFAFSARAGKRIA
jgi:hypothetical protein